MPTDSPESMTPKSGEQATGADEVDPYSIPLDELEAKVASMVSSGEALPDQPIDTTGDEIEESEVLDITPEYGGEAPKEAAEEAKEPDETATEPEAGEAEEEATEEKPEEEPETPVSDTDVLRARLEHAEAQAKHFESELGRWTGQDGFLKNRISTLEEQIRSLQSGPAPQPRPDPWNEEQEHREQPLTPPRQAAHDDPMRSYVIGTALRDGGNDFFSANPDAMVDDGKGGKVVDPEFVKAMEGSGFNPQELLTSNDPTYVRGAVAQAMQASYSRLSVGRQQAHIEELERRKSDELEKLKQKKKVSAASSAGVSRTRPKPKEEDPWKMPLDKLEAKVRAEREAEA